MRRQSPSSYHAIARLRGSVLHCSGHWTVRYLAGLDLELARMSWPVGAEARLDMRGVERMDSGGAWLLARLVLRLESGGQPVSITGLSEEAERLYGLIRRVATALPARHRARNRGALERLGYRSVRALGDTVHFAAFIGELAIRGVLQLVRPWHLRWREILVELADAGYKALPILGLLSFLLGVVIAYQGGVQLRQYGATIFIADLVGLSMAREFAPLMTAIIVAGRTGSAYTAEIGTMKVTEEVDALRSMGISPIDMLVLPKVAALLIALPLLTVYSDIVGVLGGMVMAGAQLEVSFPTFLDRLAKALTLESYLVGVGKAPVFAAIVAGVGCFQGMQVSGSAESVGRRTTVSVVHSIIAVIVVDAGFSVVLSWLGI
jgi:phospholipid/cholesterol/gamma-HCH transport system permease protein